VIELLRGVRVVECAVLLNGGLTGRLLGDMGADVVKVEAPPVGDYLRDIMGQIAPRHSPGHLFANRNKRSLALDLRSEAGREVFFDLLRTADIFVDGAPGEGAARLGIGYEPQRTVKPDIVYAQCSGFGATGPYSTLPTHGHMMGALVGNLTSDVSADGRVSYRTENLVDGSAVGAAFAALAALGGLAQRQRTGDGAYIDCAGSDSVLATTWMDATRAWNRERIDGAEVEAAGGAKYASYETKDHRFVMFCAAEDKFWNVFVRAVGREDLVAETPGGLDLGSGNESLRRELQAIFRTRTLAEWTDVAVANRLPMSPANTPYDLLDDPQLRHREIVHEEHHPIAGPFVAVGWPAPIAGQPFAVERPAPTVGQHTDEILAELGYTAQRIHELRTAKVVG
jgi:crotonobetainyl-CoA:carnitine CoA-transferase CaiB-like acyl-CoA transferase